MQQIIHGNKAATTAPLDEPSHTLGLSKLIQSQLVYRSVMCETNNQN